MLESTGADMRNGKSVTVVLPCFNEEPNIAKAVSEFLSYSSDFEFVLGTRPISIRRQVGSPAKA